jgi:cyclopropane fatty-acyl-phospholipid synthase-like methyltransferase
MGADEQLKRDRFPRSFAYHPDWVLAGVGGGANSLWLTEWLCEGLNLQPGMRVLDLGCGRGLSSIFLSREFGVQVWATDLWFSASENEQRIRDAGVADRVFPIAANARSLPFPTEFFDAVVSIDSFMFYGTDDLYMNYLARFVKPGGEIGIALAGLVDEIGAEVPEHLREWWASEVVHCLHSADWWRNHWTRSRAVDIEVADTLADGWQLWRDWLKLIAPENEGEIRTVELDAGRTLGYVRAIARRRENALVFDPILTMPEEYTEAPLLRDA